MCSDTNTHSSDGDRYVVEVFDGFHRFLERMVQPAAIDRWAHRAIQRAIPSMVMNYLAGTMPLSAYLLCEDDKSGWRDFSLINDICRALQPSAFGVLNQPWSGI